MALLYGQPIADKILAETKDLIREKKLLPGLAVLLVGDDRASHIYVELKETAAKKIGIHFSQSLFPADASIQEIVERIKELNQDASIHGIIVQLPLPRKLSLSADEIISHIDPEKDTDGFHDETLKRFLKGESEVCPVFPGAIVELLHATKIPLPGKKSVVIANSELLGQVMVRALLFQGLEAEFMLSSERKENIVSKTKKASVIVTACGIPNLITGAMISEGAIVIDGGISPSPQAAGKVVGDVERESTMKKAAFLSPVPGGVGPVTVAMLLARVTDAALER